MFQIHLTRGCLAKGNIILSSCGPTLDGISVLDEVLVLDEGVGLLRDVDHPGPPRALHLVGQVDVVAPHVELEPESRSSYCLNWDLNESMRRV